MPEDFYQNFYQVFERDKALSSWVDKLTFKLKEAFDTQKNGHLSIWLDQLAKMPSASAKTRSLSSDVVKLGNVLDLPNRKILTDQLQSFHPWRKGPFEIGGVEIDTEWRSYVKWDRLKTKRISLAGKRVLDVGSGNGYYGWRMLGEGAEYVVGIDPYLLYVMQCQVAKRFASPEDAKRFWVLPIGFEDVLENVTAFDTVFSMGVLYHQRSPFDHLIKLRSCLRDGGELILETLVIDGKAGEVLVPGGRYAKMRNVWFIPSCLELERWLKRVGMKEIVLLDVTNTTQAEQRSTKWMRFESLPDFLDSHDRSKTIEGYPAPKRAMFHVKIP
ncbi:MAG: tRNA 5-methoxyuridine(34)/uridine 5-oxyacetic acid(34) synthase CmoB [Verrucomicrobiota bacterium]